MKILHINASYKPAYVYGGPTMSVAMLCEQLNKAGVKAEVFTTTANGDIELPVTAGQQVDVDGVPVTYFKRITKDHTHLSPQLLTALWQRADGFNVIHIHAWWNLVSVLSCLIAVLKNIPVVLTPRGTLSAYSFGSGNSLSKGILHRMLGLSLLKKVYLHATTTYEKQALTQLLPSQTDIYVLPNFVKLSAKQYQPKAETGLALKLIFLSRIAPKKGLDILLEALTSVSIPYHLTIAGDGDAEYVEQLKALMYTYAIDSHVTWVGFKGEEKFDLLHDHDVMVLPSHDENFGNVVIESLSVGTPVLVSEKVGLADYVASNKLGWICQPTPASVAEALNAICTKHKSTLQTMSDHAVEKVGADFNRTDLALQYINMYKKVITPGN